MPAVKALVQVDLGPSVVLGSSLMISAIALYQVRAARPEVSRDKDVFFSSIGLLCGGILIFQGWRLDPLMLFGQLLTTATAVAFATETISLRQELLDVEDAGDSGTRGRPGRGQRGRRSGRVRSLPPVNDRNVESRVDYGARRGYSRENDEESEDAFYAATAASYGNRRAARSSTGARRGDDGDFYDVDADVSDSFDGEQSDDDASPYRDGFRAAAGDASSTPRPSSGKNWENDDWDFV